ncbi:MAG: L,D-transpeptidase family protein [Gammaproteobacteria bacterium]|nr:L,D-transpeptidase family protein [Gammaproteobacteria bacterium]
MCRIRYLVLTGSVLAASAAGAGEMIANRVAPSTFHQGHEALLVSALQKIGNSQLDAALTELHQLVALNPNFRLAQLVYADVLLAKSRPITDFGSIASAPYERIRAWRDEARARWTHYSAPPPRDQVPASLVKLSRDQDHAVVVDTTESRLYLFENRDGEPRLVHDFYATIGKNGSGKATEGDQKTPVGVYFVTGFIDPQRLPDLYGDGAFPIDYPNIWDVRHGRTGYGIWLHGTPSSTFSRPPRDSDGCVILSNGDLGTLAPFIRPGQTPVILTEKIDWLSPADWTQRQKQMETIVEVWRSDWESRNAERYISHYSPGYSGLGMDYAAWVEHKRRVNPSKRFIRVGISRQSMFLYPGEQALLVVTFEQDYTSDNYGRRFVKRQYWHLEKDGKWRIVYEGSVS